MKPKPHTKNKSPPSWAATFLYPTIAICNRAATEFSVLPRAISVRTGLGAGSLNKHKKPPAFRKGKQVVLSIWVPGGIACKVTLLFQFICSANLADRTTGEGRRLQSSYRNNYLVDSREITLDVVTYVWICMLG